MSFNCDIIFIVDESGSMMPVRQAVVSGINEFVQEQKKLPGQAAITFVTFRGGWLDSRDIRCNARVVRQPLEKFDTLTLEQYKPNGSTPLLEAICETLEAAKGWEKPAGHKFIVVIQTDGLENSSVEGYTTERVKALVDELKAAGWEFLFQGANVESITAGKSIGIVNSLPADLTTHVGTRSAYLSASAYATTVRSAP